MKILMIFGEYFTKYINMLSSGQRRPDMDWPLIRIVAAVLIVLILGLIVLRGKKIAE
jgi:hypothetical protein